MEFLIAPVIGIIYAVAIYLIMNRNLFRLILGVGLLGHGANLLIFTIGRVNDQNPPLLIEGKELTPSMMADPLPQALVLTAIVIGFGVLAFLLALIRQTYAVTKSENVGSLDIRTLLDLDKLESALKDEDMADIEQLDAINDSLPTDEMEGA